MGVNRARVARDGSVVRLCAEGRTMDDSGQLPLWAQVQAERPVAAVPGEQLVTCPASESGAGVGSSVDPVVTQPPKLAEVSPAGRHVALAFARVFLRDLVDAEDGQGRASLTRARYGFPGGNAVGLAVRLLRADGLIKAVGYDHSAGKERHGGLERVWQVTDVGLAKAWLATPVQDVTP